MALPYTQQASAPTLQYHPQQQQPPYPQQQQQPMPQGYPPYNAPPMQPQPGLYNPQYPQPPSVQAYAVPIPTSQQGVWLDGQACFIPPLPNHYLQIERATFGPIDVTRQSQMLVQRQGGCSLSIAGGDSHNFVQHFGDPQPNVQKRFMLAYIMRPMVIILFLIPHFDLSSQSQSHTCDQCITVHTTNSPLLYFFNFLFPISLLLFSSPHSQGPGGAMPQLAQPTKTFVPPGPKPRVPPPNCLAHFLMLISESIYRCFWESTLHSHFLISLNSPSYFIDLSTPPSSNLQPSLIHRSTHLHHSTPHACTLQYFWCPPSWAMVCGSYAVHYHILFGVVEAIIVRKPVLAVQVYSIDEYIHWYIINRSLSSVCSVQCLLVDCLDILYLWLCCWLWLLVVDLFDYVCFCKFDLLLVWSVEPTYIWLTDWMTD